MGYRTVIILNNDLSSSWMDDSELGSKIWSSSGSCGRISFPYGSIVEQVHADVQSLVILDSLQSDIIAHTSWYRNQSKEQRDLNLLERMAEKMGYKLIKSNP